MRALFKFERLNHHIQDEALHNGRMLEGTLLLVFLALSIRKREHKIDPCGAPKKTKQNRIRKCKSYKHPNYRNQSIKHYANNKR